MESLSCHPKCIMTLYCMVKVLHHELLSRLRRCPVRSSTLAKELFCELTQGNKLGKASCHLFLAPPCLLIRWRIHLHEVKGKHMSFISCTNVTTIDTRN